MTYGKGLAFESAFGGDSMSIEKGNLVVCKEDFRVYDSAGNFFFDVDRGDLMVVVSHAVNRFLHWGTKQVVSHNHNLTKSMGLSFIEVWDGRWQDDAGNALSSVVGCDDRYPA